jgi:hypothetical protein
MRRDRAFTGHQCRSRVALCTTANLELSTARSMIPYLLVSQKNQTAQPMCFGYEDVADCCETLWRRLSILN